MKRELEDIICKDSYEWLVRQGLICSEQLEGLKISSFNKNNESSTNIKNLNFVKNDECQMIY